MNEVVLIGASGLAREVVASVQGANRYIGILDDDPSMHGRTIAGLPVLGGVELAADRAERLLVCVGAGVLRRAIVRRLALLGVGADRYAVHVADRAVIGTGSRIGVGVVLLAGVVVTADAVVGDHVVAMPNAVVTHDDDVGDYATLAAGVALGGGVRLGEAAFLGMNAAIAPGVVIGRDAVIGMGAVVLADVPPAQTWAGVPARPLTRNDPKIARSGS
ncbi:NeuD/PglB/VioB family sugar acetyltransferase [Agromyces sp. NPDC058126]|uniref:NeuD/PglB/VioB family sugar acetyltransferase n=1 Tax=Agromyces sp. NPDC058126 TaxID=3346350 RepID=UPI0036D82203